MKKSAGSPLLIIFLTVFVDMLGFGILIPVIPLLLANPMSPYFLLPHGYTINTGYILLGFLLAIFPLGQFFATPILGQLSDRYGRKKILAISLAGTCVSYILFAIGIITKNIPLLFFSRAFDGITGGNISVAQAAIADITEPKDRAKNFGMIGAAFGLGFILGPYIGGKLSEPSIVSWFNAATPFWFAAGLSFLNVMSILLFFPETNHHFLSAVRIRWTQSIKNVVRAFTMPKTRSLFATGFLLQGGFAFFTTFFSVFLINKFKFTQGNIGDFFSFVGIWIAFTQAVIIRKITHRYPEYKILRFSLITLGLSTLFYFVPTVSWGLLLVVPFFAISNGLSQANLTSLVSKTAGREIQGEILGINASVQALAQSIPPMLSGFIAASIAPSAPIVISALVIIASGIVFIIFYRPGAYR
jgi:MFS transporter, DHA1 family, tetracycline resistance protein